MQALHFLSQLIYWSQNMVNNHFCFLTMEAKCIILLGDEYSVDFLETREFCNQKWVEMMKLSNLEERLHFLAKKHWLLVHVRSAIFNGMQD